MAKNLISKDTFVNRVLAEIERTGCSVQRAISNLIIRETKKVDFSINVRGSSLINFSNNSLDFALKQFLGVNYGKNENTIIGTAVHEGADYAYKYKMQTNIIPSLDDCLKAVEQSCEEEFKYIEEKRRAKTSLKKIKLIASKCFKAYYPEISKNEAVASEEEFFIDVNYSDNQEDSLLLYKKNVGKINLTGTLDRIYKKNDVLILNDLKTSSKKISGYVDVNPLFSQHSSESKDLKEELTRLNKIIDKFHHAENEVNTIKTSLEDKEKELSDNEVNGKPTKRIENKIKSLKEELKKWEEHLNNFKSAISQRDQIIFRLDQLEKLLKPLKREYAIAKTQADLEAAKKKYGHQLAFYAIGAMSTNTDFSNIKRLRVEVIVKAEEPYLQIFEWELTDEIIDEIAELLKTIISNIELVLEGIDPLVCFRLASETYIGSETSELLDELKTKLKRIKELQLYK